VCKISGFVGKPESARKKGAHQFFFVNGRYMKHPYFHKAVLTAFDRLVPSGEQVSYFINFTVNPEDIDVNIHPVKTEIKFENEQVIWQILMAAVRDAVGKFSEVSSLDFDTEGKPEIPVFNSHPEGDIKVPHIDFNPA
jgi:DNA mismatch repair protein MutL